MGQTSCLACGKLFWSPDPRARFCSDSCRRDKYLARPGHPMVTPKRSSSTSKEVGSPCKKRRETRKRTGCGGCGKTNRFLNGRQTRGRPNG